MADIDLVNIYTAFRTSESIYTCIDTAKGTQSALFTLKPSFYQPRELLQVVGTWRATAAEVNVSTPLDLVHTAHGTGAR